MNGHNRQLRGDRRLVVEQMEERLALSTVTGSEVPTLQEHTWANEGGYVEVGGLQTGSGLGDGFRSDTLSLISNRITSFTDSEGNVVELSDLSVSFAGSNADSKGVNSVIAKIPTDIAVSSKGPGGSIDLPLILDQTQVGEPPSRIDADKKPSTKAMVTSDPPEEADSDFRLATTMRGRDFAFEVAAWNFEPFHEQEPSFDQEGAIHRTAPAKNAPAPDPHELAEAEGSEQSRTGEAGSARERASVDDRLALPGETSEASDPFEPGPWNAGTRPTVTQVSTGKLGVQRAVQHEGHNAPDSIHQAAFADWRVDDESLGESRIPPRTDENERHDNPWPVVLLIAAGPLAIRSLRNTPIAEVGQHPPRRKRRETRSEK